MEEPVLHPKCCNADTIILHCIEMHMLIIKYVCNFKWKDVSQEGMTCLCHIFLKLNSLIFRGLISWDHLFAFLVTNKSFIASSVMHFGPIVQYSSPPLACPI
ncbi:hypothetical protein MTR67_039896 [Solanum verrucosum]|uniref:Uncharacterized protein n=1 Tax=Solanum verrucosum TaxID=315347 RepID=A0AAF0UJE5_SOLVR|nr:hypothetical protein MTR67_039896 [Solanum verrucosum]